MNPLLEFYKKQMAKLLDDLNTLGEYQIEAGVGTVGDIEIKIKIKEGQIEDLQKKIDAIESKIQIENSGKTTGSKLFIYVITGTNARIKCALAAEEMKNLYLSLNPLNHDDKDRCKWLPFLRENSYIKDLLESLKNDGYQFSVYYLDGYQFADYKNAGYEFAVDEAELAGRIGEAIDKNIENIIAIVDLLAIDNDNADIVRRFDSPKILRVVTPICRFLPGELQSLMIKKREDVFKLLKLKLSQGAFDRFQEASEKMFLKNELSRVIKEKNQFYNRISDTDSNNGLHTVSPTI